MHVQLQLIADYYAYKLLVIGAAYAKNPHDHTCSKLIKFKGRSQSQVPLTFRYSCPYSRSCQKAKGSPPD